MPSDPSSHDSKIFSPIPARKRQRTITYGRRSIKRPAPTLPTLTRRQSTLTQLDFAAASPSVSSAIIPNSSDGESVEEPHPKKRKKTKFDRRDHDQYSITQFNRGDLPLSGSTKTKVEVWQDYSQRKWERSGHEGAADDDAHLPHLLEESSEDEAPTKLLEIPETSQAGHPVLEGHENSTPTREARTRRKSCTRTEVPSSQTPPSTKSSLRSVRFADDTSRSPLKEKSDIVSTPLKSVRSPRSQNTSMKMLERVRFEARNKSTDKATSDMEPSPHKSERSQESPRANVARSPLRGQGLRRVTTVQDSQAEEVDALELSPEPIPEPRPRKLKRTATVQDSQLEDMDLESPEQVPLHQDSYFPSRNDVVEESQWVHSDYGPATFDPVNSALDRDAARFAQTQTQLSVILEEDEDSETDVEDGDLPAIAENAQFPTTKDQERDHAKNNHSPKPHAIQPIRINSNDEPRNSEIILPPSSPPLISLSQISMFPQSQISPAKPTITFDFSLPEIDLETIDGETQLLIPTTSPQRISSCSLPQTFSSSPFPLPPGSAGKEGYAATTQLRSGTPQEILQDFSLPPPPPLSSMRRRRLSASSTAGV